MPWRRSTAVPHVLSQPPSPSSTPLHTPHGQDGCGGGRWWRVTRLRSCVHRRRSLPLLPTVTVAFLNTTPCPSRAVRRWKWLVVACDTVVVACDTATKLARRWNPVHRRRSLPLLPQSSPLPLYTSLSVRWSARCSPRYRCRSSLLPRTPSLSTHTPSCLGGLMPWACRPQRLLPTQHRSSCGPAARAGHASAVLITVALRLSHCRRHCTIRVAVLLPTVLHPSQWRHAGMHRHRVTPFSARPLYTPSRRVERRSR